MSCLRYTASASPRIAARHGEQPALHHLQLHQSGSRRPERLADGDLVLAPRRPEDQQVRDVRAAKEQEHRADGQHGIDHGPRARRISGVRPSPETSAGGAKKLPFSAGWMSASRLASTFNSLSTSANVLSGAARTTNS